jgi:uncharacterized protein YdeI (YjbR/CyaY-like superfamily)
MKQLYIKTRSEWRKWLQKNYNKVDELWLIFYKKETGKLSIDYEAAVEEALCFGWIDSLVRKIDEEKYVRKFTPRKKNSLWSELNKNRVKKIIKEGRMTEFGLEKINAAKKSGAWNRIIEPPKISYDAPKEFISALSKNKKAKSNFDKFSPSDKKRYYMWINIAKKKETKERRIKESIELLSKNKELGLK